MASIFETPLTGRFCVSYRLLPRDDEPMMFDSTHFCRTTIPNATLILLAQICDSDGLSGENGSKADQLHWNLARARLVGQINYPQMTVKVAALLCNHLLCPIPRQPNYAEPSARAYRDASVQSAHREYRALLAIDPTANLDFYQHAKQCGSTSFLSQQPNSSSKCTLQNLCRSYQGLVARRP